MTLNEILFSGTTQLENIRAWQKLHMRVRARAHVMQSKHVFRGTHGNALLFIVAQVRRGLDCTGCFLTVFSGFC